MYVKILGVERLGIASVRNGEKWRSVKHAMGCVDERAGARWRKMSSASRARSAAFGRRASSHTWRVPRGIPRTPSPFGHAFTHLSLVLPLCPNRGSSPTGRTSRNAPRRRVEYSQTAGMFTAQRVLVGLQADRHDATGPALSVPALDVRRRVIDPATLTDIRAQRCCAMRSAARRDSTTASTAW